MSYIYIYDISRLRVNSPITFVCTIRINTNVSHAVHPGAAFPVSILFHFCSEI